MEVELDELERQNIINKYYIMNKIYYIQQYDNAKQIALNNNITKDYKKIKINHIYQKTLRNIKLLNKKFKQKYNIENIY